MLRTFQMPLVYTNVVFIMLPVINVCWYFDIYEQDKLCAQLSSAELSIYKFTSSKPDVHDPKINAITFYRGSG